MVTHPAPPFGTSALRRAAEDPRPPAALVVALAFAAQLTWAAVVAASGISRGYAIAGAVVVAAVAAMWVDPPAALLVAGVSFLVTDGFEQSRLGQLVWSSPADPLLLVLLVAATLAASTVGTDVVRRTRAAREVRTAVERSPTR